MRPPSRFRPGAARPPRGAIALLAAILVPLLAGFAALVVDLGRMYVFKGELQNAMDACALAASSQVTRTTNPATFTNATNYGLATLDPAVAGPAARTAESVNRLHFQRDTIPRGSVAVEFAATLAGPWVGGPLYTGLAPAAARFVRCTHNDANNPMFLLPLLRVLSANAASTMSVGATAAATLLPSQSACAFPVAVCKSPGSVAAGNYGLTVGQRLVAVNNPASGYGTGNFGWLDFTPPSGGASELRDLILGAGQCAISVGTPVGQPGSVVSLETAWNSRFGLYAASLRGGAHATTFRSDYPPDRSGFAYTTGSGNYADFVTQLAAYAPYQGSGALPGGITPTTSAQHQASGGQRRIAVGAVVDCSVWNTSPSTNPPVEDFACIMMLAPVRDGGAPADWTAVSPTLDIEFLGLSRVPGSPCATAGQAGGGFGPPVPTLAQ